MININEYLMSKSNKNPVITELDKMIHEYDFNFSKDVMIKKIDEFVKACWGEELPVEKIKSRLDKVPSNVMFTQVINSDSDENILDINIQIGKTAKTFGRPIKIDGEQYDINIQFFNDKNANETIYMIMLDDQESIIALVIGK